jgi:predicted alpha-1,2-mannosidase
MKKIFINIVLISAFSYFPICELAAQNLTKYVNPFIGTGGHGHTYPGATVPFGMVQLSPDNGTEGWDWCSGYNYSDSVIQGFSHTHLSGTGIGDWCDISVMPLTENQEAMLEKVRVKFSHENEKASPGYYQVKLNSGINVELTTTERVGFHRYTYDDNSRDKYVQFDLGFAINWDKATENFAVLINDSTIAGYRFSTGWAKNQRVYFSASFNQKIKEYNFVGDTTGSTTKSGARGKLVKALLRFEKSDKPLQMKVAISTNQKGTYENQKEIIGWNFEKVRRDALNKWEIELAKIKVQSNDKNVLDIFYTAIYHTMLSPNVHSDINNVTKNQLGNTVSGKRYTIFSLWDTFRALHPLFSVTQQSRNVEFINSMLSFCDENGKLPVWDISGWEANTMTGYHAIPVITDAILKNTKGFNYEKAYDAMQKSAYQQIRGTPEFIQYGYLPQDKHGWSATITLEYAFDDWCIAQVAKKLGKQKDNNMFMKRAASYKNIFDKETGFMRAKNSDGKFVSPFDPYYSEHGFDGNYIEGTAWQHTFFVPHDIKGYANLFNKKNGLEEKLDSLFAVTSKMNGENVSVDVSGLIGQYAHGNEPSHHIAYMYNYLGAAHKTQEKVRMIIDSMYKNRVDGLAGNDDCGQMSAWYIWSALGMYPVNPANGEYVFGSPVIDKGTITLPNGKIFSIVVKNNSKENKYINEVKLNGKVFPQLFITHQDIMKGGTLEITMKNIPSERVSLLYKRPSSMTMQ